MHLFRLHFVSRLYMLNHFPLCQYIIHNYIVPSIRTIFRLLTLSYPVSDPDELVGGELFLSTYYVCFMYVDIYVWNRVRDRRSVRCAGEAVKLSFM